MNVTKFIAKICGRGQGKKQKHLHLISFVILWFITNINYVDKDKK